MNRHRFAILAAATGLAMLAIAACSSEEAAPPASPGVCEPRPSGQASRSAPPRAWQSSACSPDQIDGYYWSCLGPREPCDAYARENPDCFRCVHSTFDDDQWGAYVTNSYGTVGSLNVGGCIAHLRGETAPSGCAYAWNRWNDCANLVCPCPSRTASERQELLDCEQGERATSLCALEVYLYDSECRIGPNDPESACLAGDKETFDSLFRRYVKMWCGGPDDAGADAAASGLMDAATDAFPKDVGNDASSLGDADADADE